MGVRDDRKKVLPWRWSGSQNCTGSGHGYAYFLSVFLVLHKKKRFLQCKNTKKEHVLTLLIDIRKKEKKERNSTFGV